MIALVWYDCWETTLTKYQISQIDKQRFSKILFEKKKIVWVKFTLKMNISNLSSLARYLEFGPASFAAKCT